MANRVLPRDPWWAYFDTGADHAIKQAADRPESDWHGPFRTFTEARNFLTRSGAAEADSLHRQNRVWRETSKAEILSWFDNEEGF